MTVSNSQPSPRPRRPAVPAPGRATSTTDASVPAVATILARLRRNSRMDLHSLSAATRISPGLLREIEDGRAVPELRDLWALARVFEVPFRLLLAGPRFPDKGFHVLRRSAGHVVTSSSGRFRCRALSAAGDPREPEVYEITLDPGHVEDADSHAEDTFEHIVVVRGELTVRAGDADATLHPGDALFFCADVPHSYANLGEVEAVAQLTMTNGGDWVAS
jgi:quercetin dioxygenase-like cupin family protein